MLFALEKDGETMPVLMDYLKLKKYGKPTEIIRSFTISNTGMASGEGFQSLLGVIGDRQNTLNIKTPITERHSKRIC